MHESGRPAHLRGRGAVDATVEAIDASGPSRLRAGARATARPEPESDSGEREHDREPAPFVCRGGAQWLAPERVGHKAPPSPRAARTRRRPARNPTPASAPPLEPVTGRAGRRRRRRCARVAAASPLAAEAAGVAAVAVDAVAGACSDQWSVAVELIPGERPATAARRLRRGPAERARADSDTGAARAFSRKNVIWSTRPTARRRAWQSWSNQIDFLMRQAPRDVGQRHLPREGGQLDPPSGPPSSTSVRA